MVHIDILWPARYNATMCVCSDFNVLFEKFKGCQPVDILSRPSSVEAKLRGEKPEPIRMQDTP